MKSVDEIESLLRKSPVPFVVEGPHKEQLKERLLMGPLPCWESERKTRWAVFARMSPVVKVAATILAAAMIVGAGWAAEKIYEKLKFKEATLTLETYQGPEWRLPNGKTIAPTSTPVTGVNPNDPKAIEIAQRQHEEIKELIGQKKYEFLKNYKNEFTGEMQYLYRFTLSDGTQEKMNFPVPLEDVDSWEDLRRKEQEQQQHYREQINSAIAAGTYRLIDHDVMLMHICLDKATQEKIRVHRVSLRNGDDIALYHSYDLAAEKQGAIQPQSSWRDHRQAIRDGRLELLDAETVHLYTYEMACEDGTKRILHHGGEKLLKSSAAR